jgi:uncharacterized repeat protein (TIGR02543 family)
LQNANNDGYTLSTEYSQTYTSTSGGLDPKEIAGYTFHHRNDSGRTYNFYYNRDTYNIDYFDGSTKLETIENVKFDADISGSRYNWTPDKPEGKEDYTWGGWCSDSGLSTPYNFTTMPSSSLVLYAKWIAPEYTVTFDLNGEGATAAFDLTETVSKHDKVSFPGNPTRPHYEFDRWYADAACTIPYDWNNQIIEDTTIYAGWKLSPLSYTVKYVDENGTSLYPDKVMESPSYNIGDEITEKAVTISGCIPDVSTKEITLSVDSDHNVITFVYTHKVETLTYTVHYVLESDHTKEVAASKEVEVSGDKSEVIESAKKVDPAYYDGDEELYPVEPVIEKMLSAGDNDIWFYYSPYKTASVTLTYVDMDGNQIDGTSVVNTRVRVNTTYRPELRIPNGYIRHHMQNGDTTLSGYEIKVTLDDGITQDRQTNINEGITLVGAGLMSKFTFLTDPKYGINLTEEEALAELQRIKDESNITMPQLDVMDYNGAE